MGQPNALTTASGRPASFGQRVRERIDTTMVIDRLHGFVSCDTSDPENKPLLMTAAQVNAARVLLNKTVPDLKAMEVTDSREVKDITHVSLNNMLDVIEGQAKQIK